MVFLFSQVSGRNQGGNGGKAPESTQQAQLQSVNSDLQLVGNQSGNGGERETGSPPAESTEAAETSEEETGAAETEPAETGVREDGSYTDRESVALYLHTYGHLPPNYITKNKAKEAGWNNSLGNLLQVCPGMSIGGDRFGNNEGLLPKKKGRKYFECDINSDDNKGYRGPERIIYSNDGLIYYTPDHYNSFELLYGNP